VSAKADDRDPCALWFGKLLGRVPGDAVMEFRLPRFASKKQAFSTGAAVTAMLTSALSANADPPSNDARAEALFATAKQLMANGQVADACPLFADSKALAPGVGVSLHLADCYERIGRTASAWQEFDSAQRMARQRGDEKRAILAETRAVALEPRLKRLTIATWGTPGEGWQVQIDGDKLPLDRWNTSLAMDPGDHTVVVDVPGQASRTLHTHLDAANNAVVLHVDEAKVPAAASPAVAVTSRPSEPPEPSPRHSGSSDAWRTGAELALVGVTATGVGFGSFFMIRRAHFIEEGPPADPTLTNQATTAATVSFVASGIALTSAFVLFFTAQSPTSQVDSVTAPALHWAIAPTPLAGGAGASVLATF
jgi:hypothetical protein